MWKNTIKTSWNEEYENNGVRYMYAEVPDYDIFNWNVGFSLLLLVEWINLFWLCSNFLLKLLIHAVNSKNDLNKCLYSHKTKVWQDF